MVPVLVMYRSRGRGALVLCCVLLACALGFRGIFAGVDETIAPAVEPTWRSGKSVAIAVRDGSARFSLPTPNPNARTLVIVSALATSDERFPVQLDARGIRPSEVVPPAVAPVAARRAPHRVPVSLPPISEPSKTIPPSERTFYVMVRDGDVASPSNYQAVRGRLRAVGRRVQVYVDREDEAGADVLREIVATFDDAILPVARPIDRPAPGIDVDGDGRFTVLMSSWLSRLAAGRHAVDGFVRGADLDLDLAAAVQQPLRHDLPERHARRRPAPAHGSCP